MTPDDKREFYILLRGSFSKLTDIDAKGCWDALEAFDLSVAIAAVKTLRAAAGANAWRPDVARLGAIAKRMTMEHSETTLRINGENDYLEKTREYSDRAKREFDEAFEVVASLTDEQIEAEKQIALTAFGGIIAKKKEHADPRTDLFLVSSIAEQIKNRGGLASD